MTKPATEIEIHVVVKSEEPPPDEHIIAALAVTLAELLAGLPPDRLVAACEILPAQIQSALRTARKARGERDDRVHH